MGFILNNIARIALLWISSIVIIAALKNSVEWQYERFFGDSRDIWKNSWQWVLDRFGDNNFMLFVFGTYGYAAIFFWLYHSLFIFMDMTEKPAFLRKYKIQEGKNSPLTWAQLKKAMGVIIPSQSIGIPMQAMFYPLQKWRGMQYAAEDLPSTARLVSDVMMIALLQGMMFYYTHRLLHHPLLYKRFHKVHHEWTSPVSITAVYAHPVEAVISNFLPLLLSSLLVGCHLVTSWVWFMAAIVVTANDHSGYHFPFILSPEFHDYHHLKFNQCYGVFGILDHIHGTDRQFLKTIQGKRHKMLFRFTPISQTIPEKKADNAERAKAG